MKNFKFYIVFKNGCFKVIRYSSRNEQIALSKVKELVKKLYKLEIEKIELI